jgi:hypothetical protein
MKGKTGFSFFSNFVIRGEQLTAFTFRKRDVQAVIDANALTGRDLNCPGK